MLHFCGDIFGSYMWAVDAQVGVINKGEAYKFCDKQEIKEITWA